MSAEAQIKSFVDRVLRLKAETPGDLARMTAGRAERLTYVIEPLCAVNRTQTPAASRAYSAAGKLIGGTSGDVADRVKMWRRRGGLQAIDRFLSKAPTLPIWQVCEPNSDAYGYVYGMSAVDFPGIVKIGFSRNPKRRLREIETLHKINLRLEYQAVGTEMDEHLVQHSMAIFSLANEWFDLSRRFQSDNPSLLLFTPDRMWKTLRGTWKDAA